MAGPSSRWLKVRFSYFQSVAERRAPLQYSARTSVMGPRSFHFRPLSAARVRSRPQGHRLNSCGRVPAEPDSGPRRECDEVIAKAANNLPTPFTLLSRWHSGSPAISTFSRSISSYCEPNRFKSGSGGTLTEFPRSTTLCLSFLPLCYTLPLPRTTCRRYTDAFFLCVNFAETELKDAALKYRLRPRWILMTLQTVARDHRELERITLAVPSRPQRHRGL